MGILDINVKDSFDLGIPTQIYGHNNFNSIRDFLVKPTHNCDITVKPNMGSVSKRIERNFDFCEICDSSFYFTGNVCKYLCMVQLTCLPPCMGNCKSKIMHIYRNIPEKLSKPRVFLLQKILNLVTKKLNPIRKNPLTIEQNKLNHFVNEFNLFLKYVKVGTRLNLIGPRGN